jgi:AcrR family transcriptional regulator
MAVPGPADMTKSGGHVSTRKRRRLSSEARREQIIAAAAHYFSEQGFSAGTRDLARELDITQALLYRYFDSKDDLLQEVFDRYTKAGSAKPLGLLAERGKPLRARLAAFYESYWNEENRIAHLLLIRAALAGRRGRERWFGPLTKLLLRPLIAELRHELGLPDLDEKPVMWGEREVAITLHGGIAFEYVLASPSPGTLKELIGLQLDMLLPGALERMAWLHGGKAPEAWTIEAV